MAVPPLIVFASLDAAAPAFNDGDAHAAALERLARDRVMVVFCSRYSRAQLERSRQALGIFHPFICEDGAAAFVPERYFGTVVENARNVGGYQAIEFGVPYEHVVATVQRVAQRLNIGITAFNDMSVEQVAREWGLSLLDARLAKLREYAEPFRLTWPNAVAEQRLVRALHAAGLTCHASDGFQYAGTAPGPERAVAVLTTLYRIAFGTAVTTVAASDDLSQEPTRWIESLLAQAVHIRQARPRDTARLAR